MLPAAFLCETLQKPSGLIQGLVCVLTSSFFWLGLLVILTKLLTATSAKNDSASRSETKRCHVKISNWIVSSAHAVVATLAGAVIVSHTKHDLIEAECNLTDVYAYVVAGYFLQDSLVLVYLECLQLESSLTKKNLVKEKELTRFSSSSSLQVLALKNFLKTALGWHHFLILALVVPVILSMRLYQFIIFSDDSKCPLKKHFYSRPLQLSPKVYFFLVENNFRLLYYVS